MCSEGSILLIPWPPELMLEPQGGFNILAINKDLQFMRLHVQCTMKKSSDSVHPNL